MRQNTLKYPLPYRHNVHQFGADSMSQCRANLRYAPLLFFLALTFAVANGSDRPQSVAQIDAGNKLLSTTVPEFELHNQTILDGLWKIARGPAPFSFGFEKVLKKNLTDPGPVDPTSASN